MATKSEIKAEEMKSEGEKNGGQKGDFLSAWTEGYATASKVWEDSYFKLYKPWVETTGKMFERSSEIVKDATAKEYQEFFNEWMNTYQRTFDNFYRAPSREFSKEALDKFINSAEKSREVFNTWINELENDAKKTIETLQVEDDQTKYNEAFDIWVKSYDKMIDTMLSLPVLESMAETYERYSGMPDIYSRTFVQIIRLWRDTYTRLYGPLIDAMRKLSVKASQVSQGDGGTEAYRDFYNLWTDTYMDLYRRYFQSMQPTKEAFDSFSQAADLYLDNYKSWTRTMERMTEKTKELSTQTTNPGSLKEFYDVWLKMYDRAFNSFFENMPLIGPMKEMMEPVKIVARMYSDTWVNMSKTWVNWS